MISRQFLQKTLVNKQLARFGGGDIRHKFNNEITDEEYREFDKFLAKPPAKTENFFSLNYFFSHFPLFKTNLWLNFWTKNFGTSITAQRNDFYRPPKVHENSVFIYQSQELANSVRKGRSIESLVLGAGLFTLTYPTFFAAFLIPTYLLWGNAYFYEMSRRLVTRMDLLPHSEQIFVQRVGFGGIIYNNIYSVSDLEYVNYEQVKEEENYFWSLCQHSVDKNLIFKCKSTGHYLLFDQSGNWDKEGLEHPLIN